MKVLITSGGTKVKIDDVRHIGNMSSGKFGAQIANEFFDTLNEVTYLHSKESVKPSYRTWSDSPAFSNQPYEDYFDYLDKSVSLVRSLKPDIIISAAAVSDYVVAKADGKLSSSEEELIIRLKKAKKVLPLFKAASPSSMVVGFKLLVSPAYDEVSKAVQKVLNSGADYVVYNDLTEIKKGNSERLIFKKDMSFSKVSNAKELTQYITNEYLARIDGQRGY